MHYWTECRLFFRQFRQHYQTTGSLLPSSRALARALTAELRRRTTPACILEVGPGTGAVTAEILRQLRPSEQLDLVEINPAFVQILEQRLREDPLFVAHRSQIRLIPAALQEVSGVGPYDYLISGLPLNNFSPALVRDIFRAYRRLLKPSGVLSYFEYWGIRRLKALVSDRRERRRLYRLSRFLQRQLAAYQFRQQLVWRNLPPAVARHLRFAV
jgi:phospholipid N-methyltransferase